MISYRRSEGKRAFRSAIPRLSLILQRAQLFHKKFRRGGKTSIKIAYSAMHTAYSALTDDEKEKYQLAFMRNSIKNLGDRLRNGSIFTEPGTSPGGTDFFAGVDGKLWDEIARAGIGGSIHK